MKQKFLIHLNNFHAKELFHKGRANDSMSLKIFFDDHTFHTSEKHSGSSGEAEWSFHKSFVYKVPVGELNHLHLEGRVLRIVCMQGHRGEYGEVLVDLYTLATGPQDHDLPLLNLEKQVVGRLSFTVVMEQFSEMKATFVFLKVKNLFPLPGHQRVHPYLRYGHSTTWREYGTFEESVVFDGHENPEWWDLFPLFFATSLSRLSRESIDVAVCHHGTFTDGEYGHVNLIFARPGKKMVTEGMECHFEGPLKYGNAAIEGKVILTGVPRYAQMIPKSSIKKCVHTETGIYNAAPLLTGLPLPKCPIIEVEDHQDHVEEDHDSKRHQVPPLEDEIHKDLHEDLPEQTKNKLAQAKELNASKDSQNSTGSHSSHKHHKHNKDNNNDTEHKQQEQQHLTEVNEPQKEDLIDLQTPEDSKKDPKSLNAMFWRSASNNYVHL